MITTILPVSRTQYLDRVLNSLLAQTLKPNNLIVIYDGLPQEFVAVRNKVVGLNFDSVLCVQSKHTMLAFNIPDRRIRITAIHKHFQELIGDAEWIFSIEDDGVLPPDALERLVEVTTYAQDVGMVTGVELGRWGVPYVGAWKADNVADARELYSMENKTGGGTIEEIDACGLYCALIRAGKYKAHDFTTSNGLGPDVNLGLYLRKEGYFNYIDWNVPVTHLGVLNGQEVEISPLGESKLVKLKLLHGNIWQSYR